MPHWHQEDECVRKQIETSITSDFTVAYTLAVQSNLKACTACKIVESFESSALAAAAPRRDDKEISYTECSSSHVDV